MLTYISAFIFYTLAMVGVLLIGFVVYKKMMINTTNSNKGMIKILDNYPIAPKKTLMVVKIKDEKFLIASGAEHTTFLAKLEDNTSAVQESNNASKLKLEQILSEVDNNSSNDINNDENGNEQVYIDEFQQARLQKLQQKFNELYTPENKIKELKNKVRESRNKQIPRNKRVLNKILQGLNSNNEILESKINNG